MNRGERIPELHPNRQFPIGDITDRYKIDRANQWFNDVEKMDNAQFSTTVQIRHKPSWLAKNTTPHNNYYSGLRLCNAWDQNAIINKRLATTGYMVTLAFNETVHYLPTPNIDLSSDLNRMQQPNESLQRVCDFGKTAWRSMQRHPNVYATFERIYEHSKTRWDLDLDEDSEYFLAGLTLPYIMSVTARLINYTPPFNGMKSERQDLRTVEFGRLFTKDVELAPDVIIDNKTSDDF